MATLQDFASDHPWTLAASVATISGTAAYLQSQHHKLRHIPTVGASSWPLLSYIGGRKYFDHALEFLQEGYERYRGRFFKITTMDNWIVIATGRDLIREIIAVPDDSMSFIEAANELIQAKYTVGHELLENQYEIEIVKRDLTRNLTVLFPDIYDEIEKAFDEHIPRTEDWIPIPALNVAMMVVSRASNRVLVGLPYCRNVEYLQKCISYTTDVTISQNAIMKYPSFLKPIVAPFLNRVPPTIKRVTEIISPEIERRRALMDKYGKNYPDKTNDFLSWMMDSSYGDPKLGANEDIAHRLLRINFAAIHTSSSTWTHALYTLAAKPEWIQPLREEVETIVEQEGMTKSAMQKMVKLDSFFRENSRTNTFVGMSLRRIALKPHTFSDGTHIPVGTIVAVPSMPHQLDDRNYVNPNELDPFRFEDVKDGDATRKYFTSVDSEYLAFGLGKHACPGRFFAGNELKAMMAHLLLYYDIRAEVEGVRPKNMHLAHSIMPNREAKIMFRKRRA